MAAAAARAGGEDEPVIDNGPKYLGKLRHAYIWLSGLKWIISDFQ